MILKSSRNCDRGNPPRKNTSNSEYDLGYRTKATTTYELLVGFHMEVRDTKRVVVYLGHIGVLNKLAITEAQPKARRCARGDPRGLVRSTRSVQLYLFL